VHVQHDGSTIVRVNKASGNFSESIGHSPGSCVCRSICRIACNIVERLKKLPLLLECASRGKRVVQAAGICKGADRVFFGDDSAIRCGNPEVAGAGTKRLAPGERG